MPSSAPVPRRFPILAVPLLLLVLVVPLWVGYQGARVVWVARQRIAAYVPVEATVLSGSVETRRSGRGGVAYFPRVRYRYTVGGAIYTSDQTTVMDLAASRRWAEEVVREFPPGRSVTAYYNPARPEEAFLLSTTGGLPYWLIGFGCAWIGCALGLGFGWYRRGKGT